MAKRLVSGCALVVWVALTTGTEVWAGTSQSDGIEFFEKKIRPVLVQHCYKCHSSQAKKLKGGLRLDSRAGLLKGGDTGPALLPGQPEKSRLIEAVRYTNTDMQMPPKGKLPAAVIADLAAWVKMQAPWPAEKNTQAAVTGPHFDLQERKRSHWAWQPLRPQAPPTVKDSAWCRGPIDRFILAKLEARGLRPAPPADRRTLIRRLSFDLVGLPPTLAEVEAFVNDTSPDAVEKVVDRLLASPRFGERWARHWLDLVRYGETRGHEYDYPIPNAYQYRDYVIRALNADVPYDQFVTEHLAGDLLTRPRLHPREGFNESVLGTGFWFLGEEVHSPVDIRQDEADRFDNKIDVLSKAFLGLTVSCARCHDHKFDAISARDYYALYGFLESSNYRLVRFDSLENNRRVAAELEKLRREHRIGLQKALADALRPGVERLADELLAAREVLRAGADPKHLEAIARAHKLDAALLARWVEYLKRAAQDNNDPFHLWARVAVDPNGDNPRRLAELLRPTAPAAESVQGADLVIDYARCKPADWMPDGVAFGMGPVRPGEVRFGNDPSRPIVRFYTRAAAAKDPTWNKLRLAPGAENDPGALGQAVRAGRTIRTPTFTVKDGRVWYLVRGTGLAYASVGSHVMIAGPLHGKLVQWLRTGTTWRWVGHDLSAYKGLPAHVEFTATGDGDFEVARVVQAPAPPGAVNQPDPLLALTRQPAASATDLARSYQGLFTGLAGRLAEDRLAGTPDVAAYSRLANWELDHPQLLGLDTPAVQKRLARVAGPFLKAQEKLLYRVRWESRLALALQDGSGLDEHVFIRGSSRTPGELVPRRFLEALAGPGPLPIPHGSGRLELGRQMTDPALNPLLPRVMVNRVWHHLFGRGIVASVDNFGALGERPTHPELLDFLAARFVREGWSVKKLIRTLVLTRTYQMASRTDARAEQEDPGNLLWHRMPLRRLEGEAIRDSLLALSGRLDGTMYGRSVPVYLTPFLTGRGRPEGGPLDGAGRRSLYLAVRRNFLSPFLLAFDTPIPFSTVGRRAVSNVPAQALILMNDPFIHGEAEGWARRVHQGPGTARERIMAMYQAAFSRPPTEAELTACRAFLRRQAGLRGAAAEDPQAWGDLAHALVNVKEFIFLR